MKKLLIISALGLFFVLSITDIIAQNFSEKQIRHWEKNPDWVVMMEDPGANYFEVVAAFESFWKNRELPVEEDQVLSTSREDRDNGTRNKQERKYQRKLRRMKKEEREEAVIRHKYAFAVKKYNHWKITVDPYVKPDGSILTKEEQLKLWEGQR